MVVNLELVVVICITALFRSTTIGVSLPHTVHQVLLIIVIDVFLSVVDDEELGLVGQPQILRDFVVVIKHFYVLIAAAEVLRKILVIFFAILAVLAVVLERLVHRSHPIVYFGALRAIAVDHSAPCHVTSHGKLLEAAALSTAAYVDVASDSCHVLLPDCALDSFHAEGDFALFQINLVRLRLSLVPIVIVIHCQRLALIIQENKFGQQFL